MRQLAQAELRFRPGLRRSDALSALAGAFDTHSSIILYLSDIQK
jgi:hypothetical protein